MITAEELYDECYQAINGVDMDDDCPSTDLVEIILLWLRNETLWDAGYYVELSEETQMLFEKVKQAQVTVVAKIVDDMKNGQDTTQNISTRPNANTINMNTLSAPRMEFAVEAYDNLNQKIQFGKTVDSIDAVNRILMEAKRKEPLRDWIVAIFEAKSINLIRKEIY